ncbi:hypothetical protein [Providencia sp. MGF014]|uniref:hypothetical protein n=1 Tax=Providencia sp. MGF014 TaxID=2565573 RepID=UPI00109D4FDF|nr:hypothetical protein [Providencia sp. MGF014]THB27362.1 hypothetical protein E6R27_08965 [Providencia sp. MGF014]
MNTQNYFGGLGNMGKKNKVTKKMLDEKLASGEWEDRGRLIGDSGTKKFTALIDPTLLGSGENNLPSRLCYVEHKEYHTNVYQADLSPVLSQLFCDFRDNRYNELNAKFNSLASSMKLLATFMDKDDISRAYEGSKEACDQCLLNITEILKALTESVHRDYEHYKYPNQPPYKPNIIKPIDFDLDSVIKIVNGNIQSIFSYILTSFFKRKNELRKDPLITNYIDTLRDSILDLFKQTVCPHILTYQGNIEINVHGSIYGTYYLHESYPSEKLEEYLKYDSRFGTLARFIDFMKKFVVLDYGRNYRTMDLKTLDLPVRSNSYRWNLAESLFKVLQDIDKLEAMKNDLESIKDLNDEKIYEYLPFNKQACGVV